MSDKKKYIMRRSRIKCPNCENKNLIKKTAEKFYCSKCKKRYTKTIGTGQVRPDDKTP